MSEQNISVISSQQYLVPVSSRHAKYRKKSPLELRLMALVVILAVLLFIFLLIIIRQANNMKLLSGREICNTENCIISAHNLLQCMDRTADPCKDFYQFSCGNYGKMHPGVQTNPYNDWFTEGYVTIHRQLKDLMQKNGAASEPKIVRDTKAFYRACTDMDTLERLGLEPIMEILRNVSLPTNIPNSESAANWDLTTTLALVHRVLNVESLVEIDTHIDYESKVLKISPPRHLGVKLVPTAARERGDIHKKSKLNSAVINYAEYSYMIEVMTLMDSWMKTKYDHETLQMDSIELITSEISIFSEAVVESYKWYESDANPGNMTLEELQNVMDSIIEEGNHNNTIDWKRFVHTLLDGIEEPFTNNTDVVFVQDAGYLWRLAELLAKTRIETIQGYVWWQVVQALAPHTNKAMRNLEMELNEEIYGPSSPLPRWSVCLRLVRKLLPMSVAWIRATNDDISKTVSKVYKMVDDVKESFKIIVRDSEWMDPLSKKNALKKTKEAIVYVGYQNWLLAPGEIDEYYSSLDLQEDQYLLNIARIKTFQVEALLTDSDEEEQRNDSWVNKDPLVVNAYYYEETNILVVPAGFLQFPFYGHGLESLSYGAIGSILGHELTHAFDSDGKDYGSTGEKEDWWGEDALKTFTERTRCFVQQYQRLYLEGMQVNGTLTLDENIADNGGIREAYMAYQRYKKHHPPEPALPGFEEYSDEQLFFLAFGNMWCTAEGKYYAETIIADEHSPEKFRVGVTVSNFPEFSKAWNCPKYAPMNPKVKCRLW